MGHGRIDLADSDRSLSIVRKSRRGNVRSLFRRSSATDHVHRFAADVLRVDYIGDVVVDSPERHFAESGHRGNRACGCDLGFYISDPSATARQALRDLRRGDDSVAGSWELDSHGRLVATRFVVRVHGLAGDEVNAPFRSIRRSSV